MDYFFIMFIGFIISLILVGILANKAGRSVVGWLLLSFLVTPFLTAIVLYFINPSEDVRGKKGLWYLLAIILSIGLFVGELLVDEFPKLGSSDSAKYTVAEDSQTGIVSIMSFDRQGYEYDAQVHNGTGTTIRKVFFRIVFYDKDDRQIDYSDVSNTVSIDAGMTKTVRIMEVPIPKNMHRAELQLKGYSFKS